MNPIKRLGVIIAVVLTMDAFIMAPAVPQQGEVAALNKKVHELHQARKFVDTASLAQTSAGDRRPRVQSRSSGCCDVARHGCALRRTALPYRGRAAVQAIAADP
jgi:hypothetical protein